MADDALLAQLKEVVGQGRIIKIVGTGVSVAITDNQKVAGYEVATWPGLLQHGMAHCSYLGLMDDVDVGVIAPQVKTGRVEYLISAAEHITAKLRQHAPGTYLGWLKSSVGKLRPSAPDLVLAIDGIPGILSTLNYDGLLEELTGRHPVTWLNPDQVTDILSGAVDHSVLHLHGWYKEPDSVVFGSHSYHSVTEHPYARSLLPSFSLGSTLLFLGCAGTFSDPNFTQFARWAGTALKDVSPRHFLFCRSSERIRLQAELRALPWLQIVDYGHEYADLAPFLRALIPAADARGASRPALRGLNVEGYRRAAVTRYQRLKLEDLDATAFDIRTLTLNGVYIEPYCKECTVFIPRVFELPKEILQRLRSNGELEGMQLDAATLAQYKRAYLDQKSRLLSDILGDPENRKTVLLGDPGSGKSTLLQHLVLDWATSMPDHHAAKFPLLIELREYAELIGELKMGGFPDLFSRVANIQRTLDTDALPAWLRNHDSVVMFDGLDEIFDLRSRRLMTEAIHQFTQDFPLAHVIVTSRVVGFQH